MMKIAMKISVMAMKPATMKFVSLAAIHVLMMDYGVTAMKDVMKRVIFVSILVILAQ